MALHTLRALRLLALLVAGLVSAPAAQAADGDHTIDIGAQKMTAPESWVRKEPKVSIIAHEFSIPKAQGDERDGRMTVMQAGGSVQANIDRWVGQFSADGGKVEPKVTKKTIAGQEVHLVDLSGTYKDQAGPFAPAVERPDYRMLAAVVVTPEGTHFLKFYGPRHTVSENEAAFTKMVEGLK